jgi:hypothetical protein
MLKKLTLAGIDMERLAASLSRLAICFLLWRVLSSRFFATFQQEKAPFRSLS